MAEWSTAYVNNLPDSSFLFIEGGGEKDEEGKTKPRSLRHLPWKDADGKVDDAHAHNALSRIPQTDGLSADRKSSLQDKVRRALGIDTEKDMSTIKDTLAKIETLLGATVGLTKSVEFTPAEFVVYAHEQIAKAATEKGEQSTKRLKALYNAVVVFKDNYVDGESESVKVPITWPDTTAMDEKSNQLTDPAKSVTQPKQTAFATGFVAKVDALKSAIEELKAAAVDEPEDEETKAKKAAEEEEDKKAQKALEDAGLTEAAKRLFAKAKGKKEWGSDAAGASAPEAAGPAAPKPPKKPTPPGESPEATDTKAKKGDEVVTKGIDVAPDGTVWPGDLNTPEFVKDGTVPTAKSLEWGSDTPAGK
jgi:hypothetical protein